MWKMGSLVANSEEMDGSGAAFMFTRSARLGLKMTGTSGKGEEAAERLEGSLRL